MKDASVVRRGKTLRNLTSVFDRFLDWQRPASSRDASDSPSSSSETMYGMPA